MLCKSITRICLIICIFACLVSTIQSQRPRKSTFQPIDRSIDQRPYYKNTREYKPFISQSNHQNNENNQSNDQNNENVQPNEPITDQKDSQSNSEQNNQDQSNFQSNDQPNDQSQELSANQSHEQSNDQPTQSISPSVEQPTELQPQSVAPVKALDEPVIPSIGESTDQSNNSPVENQSNDQAAEIQPKEVPTTPVKRQSIYSQSRSRQRNRQSNEQSESQANERSSNQRPKHVHSETEDNPIAVFDEEQSEKSVAPSINAVNDQPVKQAMNRPVKKHIHSPAEDQPIGTFDDANDQPAAKPVKRPGKHVHSPEEDKPVGELENFSADQADDQQVLAGGIRSGHSDHAPEADQLPEKSSDQTTGHCLSERHIKETISQTKAGLKQLMFHYQSIWRLENDLDPAKGSSNKESTDLPIKDKISRKSTELIEWFKTKKAELKNRGCDQSVNQPVSNDQPSEQSQSDLAAGGQSNEQLKVQSRRLLSVNQATDEHSMLDDEMLDEDDDNRVFVSSIHPYHAFTELSERDIQSRHDPDENSETIDEPIEHIEAPIAEAIDDDDDLVPGFRATITPTRLSDDELISLSHRSLSDLQEELALERQRRVERLKARRGIELQPIEHFVASIQPQRSSPIFEEDEMSKAYKHSSFKPVKAGITAPQPQRVRAGITAPQATPQEKPKLQWMRPVELDNNKPSSTRSRLSRIIRRSKQQEE